MDATWKPGGPGNKLCIYGATKASGDAICMYERNMESRGPGNKLCIFGATLKLCMQNLYNQNPNTYGVATNASSSKNSFENTYIFWVAHS